MKHSCHWKSCQKKKGWLVSEDTCQPANHISKRETVPNATSLIYQTCQHFTSAWLEKYPIYWWSLQRGIHYVRSLAVEKICTTVLHPDSEYSCLGFEFPSWTPNIDFRYSLHFLVRIFLQKYWYCSRTMNPSTHQSTARIIWVPKKNRRCSLSSSFLFLYNHFHFNLDFNICGGIWRLRKQSISHYRSSSEDWSEILRVIGFCSVDFWSLCQLKVTLSLKQKNRNAKHKDMWNSKLQNSSQIVKLIQSWKRLYEIQGKWKRRSLLVVILLDPRFSVHEKKTLLWLLVR